MFQIKVVEKTRTRTYIHLMFSYIILILAVYEIMWKNFCGAGQAEYDNIIRGMRFACWMPKVTDTLRICNTAFPLQQW